MKLLPGFTAEVPLVRRESPYYLSKEHTTFSDEVIPSQVPPDMPPSPEPDIPGSSLTRLPRVCLPTFSRTCFKWIWIRDNYGHESKLCAIRGYDYQGMVCG